MVVVGVIFQEGEVVVDYLGVGQVVAFAQCFLITIDHPKIHFP